jgi:signal transduction histidine kinase
MQEHRSLEDFRDANAALRRLNEVLEAEIGRIGHELHHAGSILATATLELDLAAKKLMPTGHHRLAAARRLLEETGEQLRRVSQGLRPTILDDLGLRPALEYLAQSFGERGDVQVSVNGQLAERLPLAAEIAIYRIVHEALSNTQRHARGPCNARIAVEQQGTQCRCTITDNGAGFDAPAVLADARRQALGLLGMRERANAVGGTCDIQSAPGQGTVVEILVPLAPRQTAH